MTSDLRWCGYCESWHSKPCGEGCHWLPTDPTLQDLTKASSPNLMKIHDETIQILKNWIEA